MSEQHQARGPADTLPAHPIELSAQRMPEARGPSPEELASEVLRLKKEVSALQRQIEGFKQERETWEEGAAERAAALKALSDSFEQQRRELRDELVAQGQRARDAERELTLTRVSSLDKMTADAAELQKLRPAVQQLFTMLHELLELLPDTPRPGRSAEEGFANLGRDLDRVVKAVRKLRAQSTEWQGREKNLLEKNRELRQQLATACEQHQRELAHAVAAAKGEIATLTAQLQAARQEADTTKQSSARRLQLLDQMLAEKRNVAPERSAVELLDGVARTPLMQAEGRLRAFSAAERGRIVQALASDPAARAALAQAITSAEERAGLLGLQCPADAPEVHAADTVCHAYAELAASAVHASGNLEIIGALPPEAAGRTLDRLAPPLLRQLFGVYLADPAKSHILHSSASAAILEELPMPSQCAAALLAPTADDALMILCGGSKVRQAMLALRAEHPQLRKLPWHATREQKERTLAIRGNEPLFQKASEALQVLSLVPAATLDALVKPHLDLSQAASSSFAILGFDLRDALLLAPQEIRKMYTA